MRELLKLSQNDSISIVPLVIPTMVCTK